MFAKLQHRALQAAQLFLVGIFFCFPVSLAATNILMALMLIAWLLAGQFKTRWQSIQNNPITLPALMLYGLVILGTAYSPASGTEMLQPLNKYSKFLFVLMAITLLQDETWRQRCWRAFGYAMLFTLASVYANIWFDCKRPAIPSGSDVSYLRASCPRKRSWTHVLQQPTPPDWP